MKTLTKLTTMIALGLLLLPASVHAMRAGFSGLTALADSPDTAFWNSAGMTRLPHSLELQFVTAFINNDFKVEEATFPGGDPKAENELLFIPGTYYVKPLNDNWVAGVSLNPLSGFGSDYGKHWSGRYLSDETSLTIISLNPSIAYRRDDWSFSGGLQIMYVGSKSTTQVNNIEPRGDGHMKLDENGVGAGFTLSSLYEFSPDTRVGVNYRSQAKVDLDGTPEFRNIDDAYLLELNRLGLLGADVDVDFKIPQNLQLGLFHQINERYSVTADFAWIDTSEFGVTSVSAGPDHVSVKSTFKDAYFVGAGLGYQWDKKTLLSVGVGYSSSPVDKDKRTLYLPLDHTVIYGVGVARELQGGNIIEVNLDFIDIGDASVDQQNSPLSGRVKGHYDNNYSILLDISYQFNLF